jgi:hypothetical protein
MRFEEYHLRVRFCMLNKKWLAMTHPSSRYCIALSSKLILVHFVQLHFPV